MAVTFTKAVKHEARGRIALIGPAGSGKSYTMLTLARELAGPDGTIAAIDTEHGSLSKYADTFDFDVIELDAFTASHFLEALTAAEKGGYSVFCCDSLSHFWMGKNGALEFVDLASKRNGRGDSFAGWKEFRPYEREMTDRMIASPCHIICTMRTKNEYVEEVNDRGKKVRRKIGLAPVQRDGLEYEFDLVGSMDEDNSFITDKTRCPAYTSKTILKPKGGDFTAFKDWLEGAPMPERLPPEPSAEEIAQKAREERADKAKALIATYKTVDEFNVNVIPFIKNRQIMREGKITPTITIDGETRPMNADEIRNTAMDLDAFVVAAIAEAKARGYKVNRETKLYESKEETTA